MFRKLKDNSVSFSDITCFDHFLFGVLESDLTTYVLGNTACSIKPSTGFQSTFGGKLMMARKSIRMGLGIYTCHFEDVSESAL